MAKVTFENEIIAMEIFERQTIVGEQMKRLSARMPGMLRKKKIVVMNVGMRCERKQ